MSARAQLASVWPPTAEVAAQAGHKPMSPMKAVRAKCLDCSCYQINEVRLCQAISCPLWPFRAGIHPYTAQRLGSAPKGPLTDGAGHSETEGETDPEDARS